MPFSLSDTSTTVIYGSDGGNARARSRLAPVIDPGVPKSADGGSLTLPVYNAGYFTSNCVKTDYNLAGTFRPDDGAPITRDAWSRWRGDAHWRQRRDGQPFFSVFNYTECHSFVTREADDVLLKERLNLLQPEDFHDCVFR